LTALRHLAPDIPVILASGYDKAHVMAGDHPEQPQVFLGKPYKLKGLSDAIGHALAKKKQISDFGDRSLWRRTEGVNGHEPNKI
jgi:DNA-binding NtrC family response regulator